MSQNFRNPSSKSSATAIKRTSVRPIPKSLSAATTTNSPKQASSSKDETAIPKISRTASKTRQLNPAFSVVKTQPPSSSATKIMTATKSDARSKTQPMRAKHTPEIIQTVKNVRTTKPSLVMSSMHNVTVTSPPPRRPMRREIPAASMTEALQRAGGIAKVSGTQRTETITRERQKTRTLEPDEILVLKQDSLERTSIDQADVQVQFKEPIAFEINFPVQKEIQKKSQETATVKTMVVEDQTEDGGAEYEDDFESYESDFETGSSAEEPDEIPSAEICDTEDEESEEETLPQITVIQSGGDKDSAEPKLDSGIYDLNLIKENKQKRNNFQQQQQPDSLDTLSNTNSEQLDSGIGFLKNGNAVRSSTDGYADFIKTTQFSSRGIELMKKIQLDTVSFQLFDMKPINYEYFMKIYGNLNSVQANTQTNDNHLESDTQTDIAECRTIWTQHPPQFDLKFIQASADNIQQNCWGESENYDEDDKFLNQNDPLEQSIKALNRFRRHESKQNCNNRKFIDLDRLNEFLNKTSATIARILNTNQDQNRKLIKPKDTTIGFSKGYTNLNSNFLNALHVVRIFSNNKFNLVLTIHESIDDIYRNEFMNLICVWSTSEPKNPIRLLSSWSEVSRADVCSDSSDIIVCGLRDGSIAMWDLRETYSYCSKLDGLLTHFAATQSIAPILSGAELNLSDLGAVVDIKSFKSQTKGFNLKLHKQLQFVSLNETGIVTIWTLVETGQQDLANNASNSSSKQSPNAKNEYHSPWARVKLIQSAICDLREYLEMKNIQIQSKFTRTRSYFENDIFNDDTLRELQETKNDGKLGLEGLRFINLDTDSELMYIATNRNFIIICSKTLKTERFRRIYIDDSKFLFPTVVRLHTNSEFLLVGLSNGSVMAINCNQNKPTRRNFENDDSDDSDDDDADDELNHWNARKFKDNASVGADNDDESIIGKSCAIQNIIRNERKSTDGTVSLYDTRPRTAMSMFIDDSSTANDYQYRLFDQQIILSGSVLRKNLVENIEISANGRHLYALGDGNIRVYDFMLEKELNGSRNIIEVMSMCLVKESSDQQNLVLLTKDNEVQVHCITMLPCC